MANSRSRPRRYTNKGLHKPQTRCRGDYGFTTPTNPPPGGRPSKRQTKHTKPSKNHTKYILPTQHRPTHHRPYLVRAIEYATNPSGQLISDPAYRGRRQQQLIECKYSSDENTQAVIDHIYNIYEPLKQTLHIHGILKAEIKIIQIIIRRTGTFNVKTLAKIAQLISFKEEPPNTLMYKLPKPAQKNAMGLHIHAQEWLSYISKISRKILATKTKAKPMN
jgi:hypothetical protein